ncbi:MAG: NUDIX domain-containing protein [Flavobacterium sp.]|nr:NUDIX domain-containing protein [Flavobacterium sp.]
MNATNSFSQPLVFSVRVYGILIDKLNRVLVSDEYIRGNYFTKFPGGGLEFGEGTRDCLKREFMEETGLDVTVGNHIYTTDIFQISAFNSRHQIISIYYYVHSNIPTDIEVKTTKFDFATEAINNPNGQAEVRRWIPLETLTETDVDLPLDKIVVGMLKK